MEEQQYDGSDSDVSEDIVSRAALAGRRTRHAVLHPAAFSQPHPLAPAALSVCLTPLPSCPISDALPRACLPIPRSEPSASSVRGTRAGRCSRWGRRQQ